MELSKRLQTIASYVPPDTNVVADIGTDHGYIPIYLIKHKIAKSCIACDINPMPLSSAKANISNYNMEDQIQTRLGNGLSKLEIGEADVIVMAGMGGMLIIDILKESLEVVKASGLLILQPQLDSIAVRKYLHTIQFKVVAEEMICEDGKYYTVIVAKPGKDECYSEIDYLLGKKNIEKPSGAFKDFIHHKIQALKDIEENIADIKTDNGQKRLDEIKKEIVIYKEVFKCL